LVETESGKKPIEEVKIGEKVLAFDEKSGTTTSFQKVTDLISFAYFVSGGEVVSVN